ncbi:MAG TPA: hypothetical protein VF242_11595, partial [Nitrososphaeraceae archaeon]
LKLFEINFFDIKNILYLMMNKNYLLLYPSLQQKPHSQIRSPKNSQATIFVFLFVIALID